MLGHREGEGDAVTNPNYEHSFHSNRKGLCQRIVSGFLCHLPKEAPAHVRWEKRHPQIETLEERVERLEQRIDTLEGKS